MSKYKKIAVTGAAGFIGKNLCNYLQQKGYEVIALIRAGKKNTFTKKGINERICDVTDINSLENAFKDVDVVIHLAALFNTPEFDWNDYRRVNVSGTQNVLSAAVKCNVKKVIHCSTVGVSSNNGKVPVNEKTPYSPPGWDKYEVSKCEAEKLVIDFSKKNDLNIIIIRPSQVYGPGDERKSKFYRMIQKGYVVNPGETTKHLIYIDELSRVFEIALNSDVKSGEVFIIADQKEILLKDLIKIIAGKMGKEYPKIIIPAAPVTLACSFTEYICNVIKIKPPLFRRSMDFFTKSVFFDVSKASEILNFRNEVDVPTGVENTIKWYTENGFLNRI